MCSHNVAGYYPVADKEALLKNAWYKFVAH